MMRVHLSRVFLVLWASFCCSFVAGQDKDPFELCLGAVRKQIGDDAVLTLQEFIKVLEQLSNNAIEGLEGFQDLFDKLKLGESGSGITWPFIKETNIQRIEEEALVKAQQRCSLLIETIGDYIPSPPVDPEIIQPCVEVAQKADSTHDNLLTKEEYTQIVDTLVKAQIGSSFEELPKLAEDLFMELIIPNSSKERIRMTGLNNPKNSAFSMTVEEAMKQYHVKYVCNNIVAAVAQISDDLLHDPNTDVEEHVIDPEILMPCVKAAGKSTGRTANDACLTCASHSHLSSLSLSVCVLSPGRLGREG